MLGRSVERKKNVEENFPDPDDIVFYEVRMSVNYGFKKNELRLIESLIEENKEVITARWKEYFKKDK